MSVVFPHGRKTLTRGKICGRVGLTALPPCDKKHPPHGFPHGFGRHPCGRRLNRIRQKRPYLPSVAFGGVGWIVLPPKYRGRK